MQPLLLQEQRAHDRRQGQRHDRRGHHGDRHGDREFAEQSADHAAHRKERDEHRDQRKGDRDDREADLAGSLERGFEGGHPLLDIADDVLDHDDRIVHDEPDRDRQSHQRNVVEAEARKVHHRESREQRQRYREARDHGCP